MAVLISPCPTCNKKTPHQSSGVTPGVNYLGKNLLNRRIHVAGVKSNDELRLYVDGKLVDAKKLADGALSKDNRTMNLGSNFIGAIDQFRFSKVARYDKDFTLPSHCESDKDTLVLYRFDEGQGSGWLSMLLGIGPSSVGSTICRIRSPQAQTLPLGSAKGRPLSPTARGCLFESAQC